VNTPLKVRTTAAELEAAMLPVVMEANLNAVP
jgi:hypothetical protein